MMAQTVNQPTWRPTNKLMVAALVTPAATEVWRTVMTDIYPALAGDAMCALIGGIAGLAAGYVVRDRPNVLVLG